MGYKLRDFVLCGLLLVIRNTFNYFSLVISTKIVDYAFFCNILHKKLSTHNIVNE